MAAVFGERWAPPMRAGARRTSPDAHGALRWFAVVPADPARIARWIDAGRTRRASAASIVVVDAIAKLSMPALAGIRSVLGRPAGAAVVVVDRLDDAGCEYSVFDARCRALTEAGMSPDLFIPVLSSTGEGLVSGPDRIDWHRGPTLAAWLDSLSAGVPGQRHGSPT